MLATKQDVLEEGYTLGPGDTITTPGTFEGESWIAPIIYEWTLDGSAEYIGVDTMAFRDFNEQEREQLELDPDTYAITLYVSEQGFVYVRCWDRKAFQKWEAAEAEEAEEYDE